MPKHFSRAINYHLGIHPLHPPKRLMAALRQAAHAQGGMLSIEPYTAAEEPATPTQASGQEHLQPHAPGQCNLALYSQGTRSLSLSQGYTWGVCANRVWDVCT